MEVTATQLLTIMPTARERVGLFAEPLNAAMVRFEINTVTRAAMFLAQVAHESGNLVWLRELWGDTKSQVGYEGRADLGNTEPGDGKRFMGRGLLQATGRDMYTKLSHALYGDDRLLTTPELLEQRDGACQSAGWIWAVEKNLNPVADAGTESAFLVTSKRINGVNRATGMPNHWEARKALWLTAKQALGVSL